MFVTQTVLRQRLVLYLQLIRWDRPAGWFYCYGPP